MCVTSNSFHIIRENNEWIRLPLMIQFEGSPEFQENLRDLCRVFIDVLGRSANVDPMEIVSDKAKSSLFRKTSCDVTTLFNAESINRNSIAVFRHLIMKTTKTSLRIRRTERPSFIFRGLAASYVFPW